MGGFSIWHILIFAIILLLLFGGNRFSAMMGDVAKGLKSFKAGMADEDSIRRPGAPGSVKENGRCSRGAPGMRCPPHGTAV
jgi:sec-independent protein translocase protein TatA